MKSFGLLILMVSLAPAAAGAQPASSFYSSTQYLRDQCKSAVATSHATGPNGEFIMGTAEGGYCFGYVDGIAGMMATNGAALKGARNDPSAVNWLSSLGLCDPTTTGSLPHSLAMVQAFLNWTDKHPERWSSGAQPSVIDALRETWPCRLSN